MAKNAKEKREPQIDPSIRRLVRALNMISGIQTWDSCGGHAKPRSSYQAAEGTFYVSFDVTLRKARRPLTLIAFTAENCTAIAQVWGKTRGAEVRLEVTVPSDEPNPLALGFVVQGKRVPPDFVAEYLELLVSWETSDGEQVDPEEKERQECELADRYFPEKK